MQIRILPSEKNNTTISIAVNGKRRDIQVGPAVTVTDEELRILRDAGVHYTYGDDVLPLPSTQPFRDLDVRIGLLEGQVTSALARVLALEQYIIARGFEPGGEPGGGETPAAPRAIGMQDARYSRAAGSDWSRDKFSQSQWANPSGYAVLPPSADGLAGTQMEDGTVNELPSGQSHVKLLLLEYWSDPAVYEVTYPAGMTCSISLSGTKTLGAEYPKSAGVAARQLTVTQLHDGSATELRFSGVPTGKTSTSLGLRPTIIKLGDTNTDQLISDGMIASYQDMNVGVYRSMDGRGTNGDLTVYTAGILAVGQGISIPHMVDLCNRAGIDFWYNAITAQTDASIRADLDYVAAHLAPGLKVSTEYANEIWNQAFSAWSEVGSRGIDAGFDTATSSASAVARPTSIRVKGNFSGVTPLRTFAAGDYVSGNISGVKLFRALQDVPASTVGNLPAGSSTSNAYWTVEINASQSAVARARYASYRAAQVGQIAKDAFTAAGKNPNRVLPVFAWWAIDGINGANPKAALEFDDNYLEFKRYAVAPYYGGALASYTTTVGGWNPTTKALYTTDLPACLNAYFAEAANAVTLAAAGYAARGSELAAFLVGKGLAADAIELCCYESGDHSDIQNGNWPDDNAASALRDAIYRDPRRATLTTQYLTALRAVSPGPIIWYSRFGALPWQLQDTETDRSIPAFAALAAQGAGT